MVDANHRDVAGLLKQAEGSLAELKAREHLANLYEKGLALCPNQEWQEADACFERVLEPHPNHKDGARLPPVCEDVRVGQVHHWDAQAARSGAG